MTDADFLAAVIAAPDDDAPRLLYADWLEERGDPRGEFIRVQCGRAAVEHRYRIVGGGMARRPNLEPAAVSRS